MSGNDKMQNGKNEGVKMTINKKTSLKGWKYGNIPEIRSDSYFLKFFLAAHKWWLQPSPFLLALSILFFTKGEGGQILGGNGLVQPSRPLKICFLFCFFLTRSFGAKALLIFYLSKLQTLCFLCSHKNKYINKSILKREDIKSVNMFSAQWLILDNLVCQHILKLFPVGKIH